MSHRVGSVTWHVAAAASSAHLLDQLENVSPRQYQACDITTPELAESLRRVRCSALWLWVKCNSNGFCTMYHNDTPVNPRPHERGPKGSRAKDVKNAINCRMSCTCNDDALSTVGAFCDRCRCTTERVAQPSAVDRRYLDIPALGIQEYSSTSVWIACTLASGPFQ